MHRCWWLRTVARVITAGGLSLLLEINFKLKLESDRPREGCHEKMLQGHLTRVIYHQVYEDECEDGSGVGR